MQAIYCRWAPSLGELEATHQDVWGTIDYEYPKHKGEPTVFFGLYDLRDYIALARHKGKAWVLWAGSDLENLIHGFAFNDGKLKWLSILMKSVWINKMLIAFLKRNAEHYCEDEDEQGKLGLLGIYAKVVPSFLGKISDYPVRYKQAVHPNVYISGHPGREEEYGFDFVEKLAVRCPEVRFHLYGSAWEPKVKNVIAHGRVSKEQFNREIKTMQCGLRLNTSDGFSEITAKSVLMGQYPITYLRYPMIPNFDTPAQLSSLINSLKAQKKPNLEGRNYYIQALNNYPWNKNRHV